MLPRLGSDHEPCDLILRRLLALTDVDCAAQGHEEAPGWDGYARLVAGVLGA
jgi:hypothetical protein